MTDAELDAAPVSLTAIGVVEAGSGARALENGRPAALPAGFDHFRAG